MNHGVINALSRRASLCRLGAAGLAALANPITTDARKKNTKNTKKQDANRLCKKQAGEWTAFVQTECEGDPDCLEFLACATPLKGCNFSGFLACFTAGQAMARSTAPGTVRVAGPLGHAVTNQQRSS